jgi:prevent-host-death family protein
MKTVTAAQANREFSKLMKLVESGEEIVVTSRGTPKIKLVPMDENDETAARRRKAFDELTEWLRSQPIRNLPRLTRDDFYD